MTYLSTNPNQSQDEIWQPVVGYEDTYEVSNLGCIRNSVRGNVLKPSVSKTGYCSVTFSVNGYYRKTLIHVVVARAFIGVCPPGMEVNHIDLDKSNNAVSNLEYLTGIQNMEHAVKSGKYKERSALNDPETLSMVNQLLHQKKPHLTYQEISELTGVSVFNLHYLAKGRIKTWLGHVEPINNRRGKRKRNLTPVQANEVKELLKDGNLSGKEIALRFGLSESQVSRIKRGNRWNGGAK